MAQISRRLRKWTNEMLDLPQDVLLDLPRITLVGNKELSVENHRGVRHFSENRMILSLSQGSLEVEGAGLMIRAILPQEVLIEGVINNIKYIGTGESS
ncbi:sporulation protein YqfC [Paenibacillus chibensis]|uniref:Sporulation protein YqfC n=1 Tax=Paenibacillus chibensis TaxID=59846 RepID=A0ABU6PZQ5_9BACL|nr:sporulation protein YqfC [Paenibacillus chibensis]MEC0369895.1 sporulation protein YqfC [Paenibacillus chibensis]MED5020363.1 sporulation protein YqfC [Paenibacillus chibensis]